MNETKVEQPHDEARLARLGFTKVASNLKALKEKKRKMMLAYEHYRVVSPEKVAQFNEELKKKTQTGSAYLREWKELSFMPIEAYEKVPPAEVLEAVEKAQAMEAGNGVKVFDAFEVAYIRNVKDPIIFGRVNGCPDRFFIAQWDTDIRIEDLLKAHEG